ncbi:MAG: Acb2/Tad1 domain-containing protein [Shimia sp.]
MMTAGPSKGEYRVGLGFNPSGDSVVGNLKRAAADLIDQIEAIETGDDVAQAAERSRLKAKAITDVEAAAMWAVKAATKPPV